jgi:uncharacterized protein YjiK
MAGKAGRVTIVTESATGVAEASGVAPLPDGSFLLVDDEHGVFHYAAGEAEQVDAGRGWADLEGVCASHDGRRVWLLAERDGAVWSFRLDGRELVDGRRLGRLPRVGRQRNAGWEGLAFAPAGTWSEAPRLIAVHQARPRQVAVLDPDSLAADWSFRLPKAARKCLGDLNDVAVHPTSGDLVVLSGKAGRLAELRRRGDAIEFVAVHRIDTRRGDVCEGLAYDASGRLWSVHDGSGRLRELRLARARPSKRRRS